MNPWTAQHEVILAKLAFTVMTAWWQLSFALYLHYRSWGILQLMLVTVSKNFRVVAAYDIYRCLSNFGLAELRSVPLIRCSQHAKNLSQALNTNTHCDATFALRGLSPGTYLIFWEQILPKLTGRGAHFQNVDSEMYFCCCEEFPTTGRLFFHSAYFRDHTLSCIWLRDRFHGDGLSGQKDGVRW